MASLRLGVLRAERAMGLRKLPLHIRWERIKLVHLATLLEIATFDHLPGSANRQICRPTTRFDRARWAKSRLSERALEDGGAWRYLLTVAGVGRHERRMQSWLGASDGTLGVGSARALT